MTIIHVERELQLSSEGQGVPRLLVVKNHPDFQGSTITVLEDQGFSVAKLNSAVEMWDALARDRYDLVLLEGMMPDGSSLDLLQALDHSSLPPVIVLSAEGDDMDRIVCLESGAADYLTKPVIPRELLARIRSVLRWRYQPTDYAASPLLGSWRHWREFCGWRMDTTLCQLLDPNGASVILSPSEHRLLSVLVENPGRVLSRNYLLNEIRGLQYRQGDRSIDVRLSRLRKKLSCDGDKDTVGIIRTVRNIGYMFTANVKCCE